MLDDGTLVAAAALILPHFGKVGATLASHVARRNDAALLNSRINPLGYTDVDAFARDYQAVSLLSKYPDLQVGIDRKAVALKSFRESEGDCSKLNEVFCHHLAKLPSTTVADLYKARDFIARVLGDFSWDIAVRYFRFGPGASIGLPRRRSHPCQKIGNKNPTITGHCLPLFEAYRKYDKHYDEIGLTPVIVLGSRGITVPKNAKTDRFIAIEPQLNMFFQKGIGAMIRARLAAFGVDLNSQWVRNQELALRGSTDGSVATLDLSRASDSISLGLVEFLLPEAWVTAMKIVRSPYCEIDGEQLFLRKFSSMGNGFTFELESLIFLALAWATVHRLGGNVRDVACFGDDIICPSSCAPAVSLTLSDVGFKLNESKSFWSGWFRESCGKHYFRGRDVTPFYMKKGLRTPHDIMWACNSLRRAANRMSNGVACSGAYFEGYSYLLSLLPSRIRNLSCPDGYGDNAIVRDFDEVSPRPLRLKNYVEGFRGKHFVESRGKQEFEDLPALVQFFWACKDDFRAFDLLGKLDSDAYSRYGTTEKLRRRIQNCEYTRWTTLGPWL